MIKRIAHLCIIASNLERTEKFYCGALGLEKGFDFVKADKRIGFYLKAGEGNFIEVFEGEAHGSASSSPLRHFCLEVEDIDALREKLRRYGVQTSEKTLGCDSSWQTWCKDPDGLDIEFHQYTDRSLQLTGGVAEIES